MKKMAIRLLKPLLPPGVVDVDCVDACGFTVVPYSVTAAVQGADAVPVTGLYAALTLVKDVVGTDESVVLYEIERRLASRWTKTASGRLRRMPNT